VLTGKQNGGDIFIQLVLPKTGMTFTGHPRFFDF
jgi:hypothetical protein